MQYKFILFLGILQCESSMCLTWRVHNNILKFRCQTTRINAKISFFNQYNEEQGYCVLPYEYAFCTNYDPNRLIYQNITSMETFLEIRDRVDQHLNGNWSCHYGRNLEFAYVNVNIIKEKGNFICIQWYCCIYYGHQNTKNEITRNKKIKQKNMGFPGIYLGPNYMNHE